MSSARPFDPTDPQSILSFGRRVIGLTARQICSLAGRGDPSERPGWRGTKSVLGDVMEWYFGIPKNNSREPDFPLAKVELKVVPLKHKKRELERRIAPSAPDATTLQAAWAGKIQRKGLGPQDLLWRLSEIVDKHFPPSRFEGVMGPIAPSFQRIGRSEMPVRTAAFLLAARFATEVIDRKAPGSTAGLHALDLYLEQGGIQIQVERRKAQIPSARSMLGEAICARGSKRTVLDVG